MTRWLKRTKDPSSLLVRAVALGCCLCVIGCSRLSAKLDSHVMTTTDHAHYHVHAVDVEHEHDHQEFESGGHQHNHNHPEDTDRQEAAELLEGLQNSRE